MNTAVTTERQLTDHQIIVACLGGNQEAFAEIIRRYEGQVAATVIGMLGHCAEADDIGQETFIRLYKNLKKYRGQATLGTYLTRIAINLTLNELRRRQRGQRFEPLDDACIRYAAAPVEAAESSQARREIVQWAINRLEPKFRAALVLRLIDGYSSAETAEILRLPLGTVLSRLSRARQQLLKLLKPYKDAL